MIKQGGKFKIQGNEFEAKAPEPMLTSRGEKDSGIIVYPEQNIRIVKINNIYLSYEKTHTLD